jgi:hypothetical protein
MVFVSVTTSERGGVDVLLLHGRGRGGSEDHGNGSDGDDSKGQVDVEAEPPSDGVGELATEERSDDTGEGEDTAKESEELGSLFEPRHVGAMERKFVSMINGVRSLEGGAYMMERTETKRPARETVSN